jgi:hypothetical protein
MKKLMVGLAVALALVALPGLASAQTCWDVGGNLMEVKATSASSTPATFALTGQINNAIAITGTAVDLGGGSYLVGVGLLRAEAGAFSVTWQLNLDSALNCTSGYFRWFNGAAEGALTCTKIACPAGAAAGAGGPAVGEK